MFRPFELCLPTRGTAVPTTPEWLHEVKDDGFRLLVHRDGDRVRLITRGGHEWTKRYPWIVEASLKTGTGSSSLMAKPLSWAFDGILDFNALHAGKTNDEVQLYAFDVLAMDGDDLGDLPLSMRKARKFTTPESVLSDSA